MFFINSAAPWPSNFFPGVSSTTRKSVNAFAAKLALLLRSIIPTFALSRNRQRRWTHARRDGVTLWKDLDADIPILKQGKAECVKLP